MIRKSQREQWPSEINHGELNTISGGFSREGSSTSKSKQYARVVMSLEASIPDYPPEPDLYFTRSNLEDVVSHEDDPVVIFVVIVERKVHRVLIDQGSLVDVIFWETLFNFPFSPDQLRPY